MYNRDQKTVSLDTYIMLRSATPKSIRRDCTELHHDCAGACIAKCSNSMPKTRRVVLGSLGFGLWFCSLAWPKRSWRYKTSSLSHGRSCRKFITFSKNLKSGKCAWASLTHLNLFKESSVWCGGCRRATGSSFCQCQTSPLRSMGKIETRC